MRKSKFNEEQIAMALRPGEAGTPAAEICRKLGISQATYFRWKKTYGSLGVPELRELRELRDENRRLKQLVADLSLDKTILKEALEKMVRPAERRRTVAWAKDAFQVSERRACTTVGVARFTVRYRSRRPLQEPLRSRLRELTSVRTYAGYSAFTPIYAGEGWPVNHKRVYRLYREEGLSLRRKKPRRRRSVVARRARPEPSAPNECSTMDFMHDALADGRTLRIFTLLDAFTRECLALRDGCGFSGASVAEILSEVARYRPLPQRILVDNGTEFTSKSLDAWAYWNQVKLDFSRPGRPGDNAHIEAFNSQVRRECLSQHWIRSHEEAASLLEEWKNDYNHDRPHGSLGQTSPARYRAGLVAPGQQTQAETRRPSGSETG